MKTFNLSNEFYSEEKKLLLTCQKITDHIYSANFLVVSKIQIQIQILSIWFTRLVNIEF